MKKIILIILLANSLILANINHHTYIHSRIRLFEACLETLMDDYSLRTVSVRVVHNQEIVHVKGFGYADFKNNLLADEMINYKIASITKLFTSIALMQLVEQDKININDPDKSVKPKSLAINKALKYSISNL